MNAEALKAPYEGPLTADIEPPIAGAVDRSGTARVITAAVPPRGGVQRRTASGAQRRAGRTEDRSSLEMKHLYREDLRRLLVSEKPRAWPRGIRWIIEHAETHPVGVYRPDEHRPTATREQVT